MTVRVAAIGTGRWGGTLADAAGRGTGLSIVACTSRSAENRAAFAKTYRCRDLPTLDAVLADREVEGVLITTPHTAHAEHIVAAASAGKHVFVDKPFTLTVADARRATEACRRAGVVLAVGHQRRKQAASGARLFLARRGQAERKELPLTPADAVVEELTEFARCVRDRVRPEVSGEEGTATVAVLEAIVQSAESGRAIDIQRSPS